MLRYALFSIALFFGAPALALAVPAPAGLAVMVGAVVVWALETRRAYRHARSGIKKP